MPVLWWRSVGATHTAFVMEHTIDQLARKAGKDPVDYRRALYAKAGASAARHLAVLEPGRREGRLGQARAGRLHARGVAVHESFGSVVAQVAEVKLENGEPRVGRVVTAIDCGVAIAPDQIAAQMEGGTCYGLSAALFGQITLKDGVVAADQLRRLPGAAHERGAARGDLHRPLDQPAHPASASPARR